MVRPTFEARERAADLQERLSELILPSPAYSRIVIALDSTHVEIDAVYLDAICNELESVKKEKGE